MKIFDKHTHYFENSAEFTDFADGVPAGNHSKSPRDEGFIKFTFAETVDHLKRGWEDGVKGFDAAIADLPERYRRPEQKWNNIHFDVSGETIDMGRYLSDEPECFSEIVLGDPAPSKEIVLISNGTAAWFIEQDAIINRGAAVCHTVDMLRNAGYRVTVYAIAMCTESADVGGAIQTILKMDTREFYSKGQAAAYLAHPGMLRRLSFAVTERKTGKPNCGGYGTPTDPRTSKKLAKGWNQFLEYIGSKAEDVIFLPGLKSNEAWATPELAMDKIAGALREQGIELNQGPR